MGTTRICQRALVQPVIRHAPFVLDPTLVLVLVVTQDSSFSITRVGPVARRVCLGTALPTLAQIAISHVQHALGLHGINVLLALLGNHTFYPEPHNVIRVAPMATT